MPQQKRPEQRSMHSKARTPDQGLPQPTGMESYTTAPGEAEQPEREQEATPGAAEGGGPEWDRYLNDSVARLQEVAIGYFNRLGESAGDVSEQARQVYANSRTYVGSHPGSTVGGAFLFGVLLGFLIDRD